MCWGNMISKKNKNNLYKIQTECIKALTKKAKNYPSRYLYNQYSILPFTALTKQELTKLGYKISNDHLPGLIINLYKKIKEKRIINTPLEGRIYQMYKDTQTIILSLIYYSELPSITRNITKFSKFKRELKNHSPMIMNRHNSILLPTIRHNLTRRKYFGFLSA